MDCLGGSILPREELESKSTKGGLYSGLYREHYRGYYFGGY